MHKLYWKRTEGPENTAEQKSSLKPIILGEGRNTTKDLTAEKIFWKACLATAL